MVDIVLGRRIELHLESLRGNSARLKLQSSCRVAILASMGVTITVRNVPEETRDELAQRAARSGRSLQEYLAAQLVEMASRPAVEDVIARARTRARATGGRISPDSLVADRDAERP